MIPVSNAWREAHTETLLPEMFLEISYSSTEPGLLSDAVVGAVNGHWEDGIFESDYVAGEDRSFSYVPSMTLTFPTIRAGRLPGITIKWDFGYATRFRVQALLGTEIVAQTVVNDNTSHECAVFLNMEQYDKIVVDVLEWSSAYSGARCSELFPGIRNVYTKNDLMGFEHIQTADLLSASLPKNEITFRLRNDDNRWNPDNPTGFERYLVERQEIRLRYGMMLNGEVEWIPGGTFWLSEWDTPSNGLEATFTARDVLEFMNEEYTGIRTGTLYQIAMAAFEQADLPVRDDGGVRYVVDTVLGNYTTDLSADTNTYTIAEILQMVAHAGNCVMWQDSEGVMHIAPWSSTALDYRITKDVSYNNPEYTINKPLKSIVVSYGENSKYVVSVNDKGGVQTVENVMLNTADAAGRVANRAKEILINRKVISGEYRADVRLEVLDPIIVSSKYATNLIAVTDIRYETTGGAIRGIYSGRVISVDLRMEDRRSGEFYVGEYDS